MTHPTDSSAGTDPPPGQLPPPITFDPVAARAWCVAVNDEHPDLTNVQAIGVDDDFGRDQEGFLATVAAVLYAWPPGLTRRSDVRVVLLWLTPDGDVLGQGALITVDLVDGVRLASLHQDLKDFADRADRGVATVLSALSALSHIAAQVSMLADTYQHGRSPSGGTVR